MQKGDAGPRVALSRALRQGDQDLRRRARAGRRHRRLSRRHQRRAGGRLGGHGREGPHQTQRTGRRRRRPLAGGLHQSPAARSRPRSTPGPSPTAWRATTADPLRYAQCRESWDAALDCERLGVQIRDVHGEFEGAEFRDPETQLMFAYDYEGRHTPAGPRPQHEALPAQGDRAPRRQDLRPGDGDQSADRERRRGRPGRGRDRRQRAHRRVLRLPGQGDGPGHGPSPARVGLLDRAERRRGDLRRPEHRRRRPRHGLERRRRVRRRWKAPTTPPAASPTSSTAWATPTTPGTAARWSTPTARRCPGSTAPATS